jgi:hypothetical protein
MRVWLPAAHSRGALGFVTCCGNAPGGCGPLLLAAGFQREPVELQMSMT